MSLRDRDAPARFEAVRHRTLESTLLSRPKTRMRDSDLVLRIRRDPEDQDAFVALLDRYSARLWWIARSFRLPPGLGHEDLYQEIAQHLWRQIRTSAPTDGPLGAWIGRVARNRCIDVVSPANRRAKHEVSAIVGSEAGDDDSETRERHVEPADRPMHEFSIALEQALESLRNRGGKWPAAVIAFLRRVVGNEAVQDIASDIEVSTETIRRWHHAVTYELAQLLAPYRSIASPPRPTEESE